MLRLILQPERIEGLVQEELIQPTVQYERRQPQMEAITHKLERLLILYEDGEIDKQIYLARRDQHQEQLRNLERESGTLRPDDGRNATSLLQDTLRILARSAQRFTAEQQTRVFRSMVKTEHFEDPSLTLDLYSGPIDNLDHLERKVKLFCHIFL